MRKGSTVGEAGAHVEKETARRAMEKQEGAALGYDEKTSGKAEGTEALGHLEQSRKL